MKLETNNTQEDPSKSTDRLVKELLTPQYAVKFNNYAVFPEYEELVQGILEMTSEISDFETDVDQACFREFKAYLLRELRTAQENRFEWFRLCTRLQQGGRALSMQEPEGVEWLFDLDVMAKDDSFMSRLSEVKKNIPHGHIISLYDVFPEQISSPDAFIKAKSETFIRKVFNYQHRRINNLEDIGFIFEDYLCTMFIYRDKKRGKTYRSRKFRKCESSQHTSIFFQAIKYKKENNNSWTMAIHYKIIKGIDREKHLATINQLNSEYASIKSQTNSKQHKTHKQRSDTNFFKDENGLPITATQYADRHSISRVTAYSRLKKLNADGQATSGVVG